MISTQKMLHTIKKIETQTILASVRNKLDGPAVRSNFVQFFGSGFDYSRLTCPANHVKNEDVGFEKMSNLF